MTTTHQTRTHLLHATPVGAILFALGTLLIGSFAAWVGFTFVAPVPPYRHLPFLYPPLWFFWAVWFVIYPGWGVATWLVWRQRAVADVRGAMALYTMTLIGNTLFLPIGNLSGGNPAILSLMDANGVVGSWGYVLALHALLKAGRLVSSATRDLDAADISAENLVVAIEPLKRGGCSEMKRRTLQSSALERREQRLDRSTGTTHAVNVPAFALQPDPMPACLARWMGNLLYWVTSMGAQYYATVVAPLGLTPAQIAVLQVLADEGMMRQARLTDRTRIDKATMVGLLNELEEQALIERRAAPRDKRAFDIYLTEHGAERVRQVEEVSQEAEDQFYGVLSVQERQALRALPTRLMGRTAESAQE